MKYQRFVALGDSCTEGLDDLLPDGAYRGWADRVASVLDAPGFRYANLGVRGRRLDAMVRAATSLAPTVAVFTLSDISHRMPFGWRMRPRIEALNDAVRTASRR